MGDFKGYWKNYEDENYVLGSEEYCAQQAWKHQQAIINNLKAQPNNMEACYIEKKKQVEAVEQVLCELKESLRDFQEMDLYDKGHRVTTEYVIADLEKALRGANDYRK